jgi:hypothetical protein
MADTPDSENINIPVDASNEDESLTEQPEINKSWIKPVGDARALLVSTLVV